MKRVYLVYFLTILLLLGCKGPVVEIKTGNLNIRSYSEQYTDPSTISENVQINSILDITFPDNSTETIITDDLGYYILVDIPIGDYIIQPRYCSTNYKKIFTVSEGLTTTGTIVTPKTGLYFYAFNTNRTPINLLSVRQALCKAINRQQIINAAKINNTLAFNTIPEKIFGNWSTLAHSMNESVIEANNLLGSTNSIDIEIIYNDLTGHQLIANEIKKQWENLSGLGSTDVNVTLKGMPWDDFIETIYTKNDFQVARFGWLLDSNNLLNFYKSIKYDTMYENLLIEAQEKLSVGDYSAYENKLVELNDYLIDNAVILPLYFYK